MRHFAGGEIRASRTRRSHRCDRRQRDQPAPHPRSRTQAPAEEPRVASTPDRASPEIRRTFDLVVCTGVLHHLPDPDEGLRALRNVLKPGGAMRVMVYAPYGRAGVYMMQEYCRLLGVNASPNDLRDLGAVLDALPVDHPIAGVLRHAKDFRRPDAMADALLHPQDRAYSVPELYAWLDRCGMCFGRWIEQAPYLAQCGLVARQSSRRAFGRAGPADFSTPPSSFFAERWSRTASSPTATIVRNRPADRLHRRRLARLHSHSPAMDRLRPGTSADGQRRGADQSIAHVYRPHLPDRRFRGPAARRHRREAHRPRNSAIGGPRRRKRASRYEVLRATVAIRSDRLRCVAHRGEPFNP